MTTSQEPDDLLEVREEVDDNEPDVSFDIASYPSDLTISVVAEMWRNGDIVIPEYQRNYVWGIKQASLLIESFLIGLPVPQVFFYVDEENKSQVIDGQQRLMSVVYYLDGHFGSEDLHGKNQTFRLHGLSEKSPFAKKRFVDLSDAYQRKLKSAVIRAINIRQLNPSGEATSVYHIFERLNTGGTPLRPQEIRNCVFRGNLAKVLRELNQTPSWRKIIGKKTLDKHQKDVELLLRIYGLTYFFDEYAKPMKEFLNRIMLREKSADSLHALLFHDAFATVSDRILSQLGTRPFHIRGPLNSAALDAVFATLLSADSIPDNLADRYKALIEDSNFYETTFYSTSDRQFVERRFDVVRKYLLG